MSLVSNPGFGSYSRAQTPEEPTIVQLFGGWNSPGLPSRDQNRVGRAQMLGISLETFEKEARDQLQRAMGPYGFDADRDIAGITVNRWAHGVTGGANDLFDPEWPRDEAPWVKGRKRFGLITIANSDSGATALTQCAFDQAHRAVSELMYEVIRPQGDFAQGERI
jgi:spermidine dehydrogenase